MQASHFKLARAILIFLSVSVFATEKEIPQSDRQLLNAFFRNLLFSRGFAYTLFGDKPVSIADYDFEADSYWIAKKYVPHFPAERYIFLFDENSRYCEITLINKEAFCQIINQHREQFAEVFGAKISPDRILDLLIQKRSIWNTPIKNHENLIGVLLGYGKTNAALYHQRSQINSKTLGIRKHRKQPSFGYSTMEEELEALNTTLCSFSGEGKHSIRFMRLPGFVADPKSLETKKLKKKYSEQRRKIAEKYAQEDTLKIVLEHLYH
jgi:hypothetical protein